MRHNNIKKVVEIKTDYSCDNNYFYTNGINVKKGDNVIVNGCYGLSFGTVIKNPQTLKLSYGYSITNVVRLATSRDKALHRQNMQKSKFAFGMCKQKIKYYKLDMKLIHADVLFDENKIIFYFISDKRVDFRELVKDLARSLHTRIELRQVGVRDETKKFPTIGTCGRRLCCSSFLKQFQTVSIKMAKDQKLTLNPVKISGNCGRLMCCLNYEEKVYEELSHNLPEVDEIVMTPDGKGKVMHVNVLSQIVKVAVNNKKDNDTELKQYKVSEIKRLNNKQTGDSNE